MQNEIKTLVAKLIALVNADSDAHEEFATQSKLAALLGVDVYDIEMVHGNSWTVTGIQVRFSR